MRLKFVVIFFVLSLASCRCGLLNWFSRWTEELDSENGKIKCRERRTAEENRIKPDTTTDKIVSLMDIERGKLTAESTQKPGTETHEGNSKAKRSRYMVSANSPIVGAIRQNPVNLLPFVKTDSTPEERCKNCRERPACRLLGQCAQCYEFCKNLADDFTRPLSNQTVGMAHRMNSPDKNDIFSKTLYPIYTFREGETKDIICRIVGITDTSDIETVTIWVTTMSNTPPKLLHSVTDNLPSKQIRKQQEHLKQPKPSMAHGQASTPDIQGRFNDYDDDDGTTFSRGTNDGMDKIKANPDVIEGPPPFVGSASELPGTELFSNIENNDVGDPQISENAPTRFNKPLIVQPKEFLPDDSDDDNDIDDILPFSPVPSLPQNEEPTSLKSITKPTLLSRLREFASRTNRISDPREQSQQVKNVFPTRAGFIEKLLKPDLASTVEPPIISTPVAFNSLLEQGKNIEKATANGKSTPLIRLPGENDDQIAQINKAIQDVKSMVKNIQEEASKASDKRLLGASHIEIPSEDLAQNNIAPASVPVLQTNQIRQMLPSHVADNLKKVNHFFINRAQDALDVIGPQETGKNLERIETSKDEHADIMKSTITNFKKMPQFLLERVKDTLNGFEKPKVGSPVPTVDSNGVKEATEKELELIQRFGGDEIDREENASNDNIQVGSAGVISNDDPNEPVVGLTEQSFSENNINQNMETSLHKESPSTYKNKMEKYLAEVKEKRQRKYSPEKYVKSPSTKSDKITSFPLEEVPMKSTGPSTDLEPKEVKSSNESEKTAGLHMLASPSELEKQRELLRQKLRTFIDQVKSKASSGILSTSKIDESTSLVPSTSLKQIIDNVELNPIGYQHDGNTMPEVEAKQPLSDLTRLSSEKEFDVQSSPTNNIPNDSTDQVVGKSNFNNDQEVNNVLNSAPISTFSNNGVQNMEAPNKFYKYFEDFKAKQSLLMKPKKTSNTIETGAQNVEPKTQLVDKQDLLKTKIKNYVDNLKKPVEETVGQPAMSLGPRMSDPFSNLNNEIKADMKNLYGSTPDIFKKDILKEKLKNYVASLRKPMESRLLPDLTRKSSKAQREELNSLKKKLESLLKANEPSVDLGGNPLVSEAEPRAALNLKSPLSDKDMVPVISRDLIPDVQNNAIVGDIQQTTVESQFNQDSSEPLLNSQATDNQDNNLQSIIEDDAEILDWSHNLGKIVQSASKPTDIFFLGSGIKLPLKLTQGPNGSMDLSVDLEKLCSCNNNTCPRNQTAIEETVGAILEKEAELNEQLNSVPLDDGKVEPIIGSSHVIKPDSDDSNLNKRPNIMQKLLGNLNPKTIQKRKSNIFKRSSDIRGFGPELTTIRNFLEKLKKENEKNIKNNISREVSLSKLPPLDTVADLGKTVKDTITNSVQELTNNVEELREQLEHRFVAGNKNANSPYSQDVSSISDYNNKWLEASWNEIKEKADEINNNFLEKVEHQNTLNNLLGVNRIQNNRFINSLKPDIMTNNILKTNSINKLGFPAESRLSMIEDKANDVIKNFEQQNFMKTLMGKLESNKLQVPKIPTYSTTINPLAIVNDFQETIQKSLPMIPGLQNRMNEINDDVVKITDTYQYGKANILEKKLKQLDDEVQKYYENNEKLLADESKKLFGGHNEEIVEKEVNIINRIISWIRSLASGLQV